jgi:hypothetical protein
MFFEIVGEIVGAFTPMHHGLALFDAITYPIKTHVNGFWSAFFESFVGDAGGTRIVCLNWCGGLVEDHFDESVAKWYAVSIIMEKCS